MRVLSLERKSDLATAILGICDSGKKFIHHRGNFLHPRFKHNFVAFSGDWVYFSFHCSNKKEIYDLNGDTSQELVFEEKVGYK